MAVNLIVLCVTLLMVGFIGVYILFPRLRAWMEMPKHRFLESQRHFPSVLRRVGTVREQPSEQERRRP